MICSIGNLVRGMLSVILCLARYREHIRLYISFPSSPAKENVLRKYCALSVLWQYIRLIWIRCTFEYEC